jgi:hypothetical protein
LEQAVQIHPVDVVHEWFLNTVESNAWGASTLSAMYAHVRQRALIQLMITPNCLDYYGMLLESNHIALIVTAEPPGNHGPEEKMKQWELYPLFLGQKDANNQPRPNEPGWDKAGHFLVNALLAFESKYTLKYPGSWGTYQEPYAYQVGDTADFLDSIVGSRNIQAVEEDYRNNQDAQAGYIDSTGLDFDDSRIFNYLATMGSAYEILTSFNGGSPGLKQTAMEFLYMRIRGRGEFIDATIDELLRQPKTDAANEGLLDSGLYRDLRANRLGILFGLSLFNNPLALPPEK